MLFEAGETALDFREPLDAHRALLHAERDQAIEAIGDRIDALAETHGSAAARVALCFRGVASDAR